jgi:hypothetical protein
MNLLAGIKALGGGIASIPRRLNEARFNHETVNVPASAMPRMSGAGVNPDDMVVIGKDPDTGEDITIPQSQLSQFGMDPATGQVMGQKQVRTGPSKFGNFLKNGLPRIMDAGIAAATSPGDGRGGFLEAMKGMDIGRDRLQKRDMMAYNQQRQRQQDAMMMEDRAARAEENRAQADLYRRKLQEGPADPLATLKARASEAGLVPGTQEYQNFMRSNGAAEKGPTSYEQLLMQRRAETKDPAVIAAIDQKLERLHLGTQPKDPGKEWDERKKRATELNLKPDSEEYKHYMANGTLPAVSRGAANPQAQAEERAKLADKYGLSGSRRQEYILNGRLRAPENGPLEEKGASRRDSAKIEADKVNDLQAAERAYRKKISESSSFRQGAKDAVAREALEELEREKALIQEAYEQQIRIFGGSVATKPQAGGAAPGRVPSLLTRELPLVMQQSGPFNGGQEGWMRSKKAPSLFR